MEELLTAILDELRQQRSPLGFGYSPKPKYIYAAIQDDCLWYHWNHAERKHEPILFDALTCKVLAVKIGDKKEYKGRKSPKLLVYVMGDRPYVIESGLETVFSKALIAVLANSSTAVLRSPITIAVRAGESEKVLFCSVYSSTGEKLFFPVDEGWNLSEQVDCAIANVEAANGGVGVAVPLDNSEGCQPTPQQPAPAQPKPVTRQAPNLVLTPPPNGERHLGVVDAFKGMLQRAQDTEQVLKAWEWINGANQQAAIAEIPGIVRDAARWRDEALRRVSSAHTPVDVGDAIAGITVEMQRLGMGKKEGSARLLQRYGVGTRAELTEQQVADFWQYLRGLQPVEAGEW